MNNRFRYILLLLSLIILCTTAQAQDVWENPTKEIYNFLYRQAQKGNIEIGDFIKPYSRKEIAIHLETLQQKEDQLSSTERKELKFYQKEYAEFSKNAVDETSLLKKDQFGRLRFISVRKDGFLLNGDPTLQLNVLKGTEKSIFGLSNGAQFWGHAGKNIAFQAGFTDNTESGDGLDSLRQYTAAPGIVRTSGTNSKSLNYSNFRGYITYSWKNGSIALGNDQLQYGYGVNGKIILSDKAPAYPFIKLEYQPLNWLKFMYSHAWLQSGIIDSAATYNKGNDIYGNTREQFIPKFMASHSLNFFPLKGLALSMGESVVYSDKLQAGYLFPLMFFKVYDQHASQYKIRNGSNSQFFFTASSRNHIRNTHLYATLFIDEIRMAEIFNPDKSRNQLGFNLGASITDFFIPYLTIGTEYTRINPFNYQNLIPAQNYTHQNYVLGDWMGANADRFLGYISYTPLPKLKTTVMVQNTRKGDPGNLFNQYFAEPQPKFLDDFRIRTTQYQVKLAYEWLNNIYFYGNILFQNERYATELTDRNYKELRFGINVGI